VLRPQCRCTVISPLTERPGRDAELNIRRGHEIVHRLQNITAPSVFNPRAFFDGKKNLFSVGPLKMQGDAAEVRRPPLPVYVSRRGVDCSHTIACVIHTVLGQYVRLTTTPREHPRSVSRKADESERHVNVFLRVALRLGEPEADLVQSSDISRRANEIFSGRSDVSQIAVTFLQIVIRQAPML
jgi:hypothetical protein